jgi:hypothetical protein
MVTKKKGGRPKIELTPKQIKEVEELSAYFTCEQIADYFGISHTAFQDIRARQPQVLLAYKKGRTKKILKYTKLLEDKAGGANQDADATSIIFYLKTQAGWSTDNSKKLKIKITGQATPVDIINQVIIALCKEDMSMSEIKHLSDLAQVKQQLLSNPLQQEQTQSGISEEFILKHIDKFNEAMRHINEHRTRGEEA